MNDGEVVAMTAALAPKTVAPPAVERARIQTPVTDLSAQGEPFLWGLGGALALGVVMIVGFLILVFWNGIVTFFPGRLAVVTLNDGTRVAGEETRVEKFRPPHEILTALPADMQKNIATEGGFARRMLYRTGNYDLYNDDFKWVSEFQVSKIEYPKSMVFVERLEWGPFVGAIKAVTVGGATLGVGDVGDPAFKEAHSKARARWHRIRKIERGDIGAINHALEKERLNLRRIALTDGADSAAHQKAKARFDTQSVKLQERYKTLAAEAQRLKQEDEKDTITLAEIGGKEKTMPLSFVVRLYPANDLSLWDKVGVYLARWWEFLSDEPREANTEGGVWPAIFGTFAMTLLMVIAVTPFGVLTALYLREYAKQGRLVAAVRISVNNLAGVPSIVYGVFGLGFFAYVLGAGIDQLFYPERLPNPTFGTGGLLWSSLTLALLTVPVVIVATEEALSAVPRSMREGSLACGASKWQTIRHIVLPRAMPGIMTGIILAMARGAGEVAPLMLVGVVKLAPELPIDGFFPYIHLERSFMHLGFHIYDVGFQSRNSEAGKPMVFVTTLLLIGLIALMNISAIIIRNRLKRKFVGSQF
jgi:phosphate transport system permease protein